jgi:MarR family transcriptional regulator, transcriptional regulator for hemolysin
MFSNIGRTMLSQMNVKLRKIEIKRYFYALILIGEGEGLLTQQDLAELLNSDKVIVVRIVDYLSNRGYVKRMRDSLDRRKYRLTLTKKAEKELPLIRKALEEITSDALRGLTSEKIEELYNSLRSIKNNLNHGEVIL